MKTNELILDVLRERGMTYAELGRRIGLNRDLTRRMLVGERHIRSEDFVKICHVLNLTLDDFQDCAGCQCNKPQYSSRYRVKTSASVA